MTGTARGVPIGTARGAPIGTARGAPIGVAVVGAGYWGPNLARNVAAHPSTHLAWVCDLDLDRARAAAGAAGATDDFSTLLDDAGVHAVAIATPAASHFELAREALEAGKHVLVEKPLAASSAEARKLVDLAERSGLVLMCDHTYCYTEAARVIRERLQRGDLGDIQYVDSIRVNLGLLHDDVDVIWDLAPHDLSLLHALLGERSLPLEVSAIAHDPIGHGRPCLGHLTVRLASGPLAHIHVNWLSPVKVRRMTIGGSRRMVLWDDLDPGVPVAVFDRGVDVARWGPAGERTARVSYRLGDMTAPAVPNVEALRNALTAFATAIHTGCPPLSDGSSAVWVISTLEAAQRSVERGGAFVPLEPGP